MFVRVGRDGGAEIVLLDHGLYDCLRPHHREHLCHLYRAIIMRNEDDMRKFSHLLGVQGRSHVAYILHAGMSPVCLPSGKIIGDGRCYNNLKNIEGTMKSFNFMDNKFRLTRMDMFVDTRIRGFQISIS